jgi:hypothetical protein
MPDVATVDLFWPSAKCLEVPPAIDFFAPSLNFYNGHFADGVRVQWHSGTTATLQIACASARLWVQWFLEVEQGDDDPVVATRVGTCGWSGSCRQWRFQPPQPVVGVSQLLFATG